MTVNLQPVESSNLESIGYDSETKELHVKFLNGSLYKYLEVPQSVFFDLQAAESKGKFLNKNIKNVFQFERVV